MRGGRKDAFLTCAPLPFPPHSHFRRWYARSRPSGFWLSPSPWLTCSRPCQTSPRFNRALELFAEAHAKDVTVDPITSISESQTYHSSLDHYVRKLSAIATPGIEPSEALLLAANSQHIRRWEKPRKDWPEGLSGYKTWRVRSSLSCAEQGGALSVLRSCRLRADQLEPFPRERGGGDTARGGIRRRER